MMTSISVGYTCLTFTSTSATSPWAAPSNGWVAAGRLQGHWRRRSGYGALISIWAECS